MISESVGDQIVEIVATNQGTGPQNPVFISSSVHTYVHQVATAPIKIKGFVVPPFASHWAVIVEDNAGGAEAYHLVFEDIRDAAIKPLGKERAVKFDSYPLASIPNDAHQVGTTKFQHSKLKAIGRDMVKAFGTYHRVFWNCQIFAKCYLRVITGDHQSRFEEWTSSDVTNLFVCGFGVGAPFHHYN